MLTTLAYLLLFLAGCAIGFWLFFGKTIAKTLASLEDARVCKLDEKATLACLDALLTSRLVDPPAIAADDFSFLGAYRLEGAVGEPLIIAWQHNKVRTQLRAHSLAGRRIVLEIATALNSGQLRTSSSKDAQMLPPPPDGWIQSFDMANASELMARHKAAMEFLHDATGQVAAVGQIRFEEDFPRKMREYTAHVRSYFMWRWRAPYWYFVRRNRLHGKSVREQF